MYLLASQEAQSDARDNARRDISAWIKRIIKLRITDAHKLGDTQRPIDIWRSESEKKAFHPFWDDSLQGLGVGLKVAAYTRSRTSSKSPNPPKDPSGSEDANQNLVEYNLQLVDGSIINNEALELQNLQSGTSEITPRIQDSNPIQIINLDERDANLKAEMMSCFNDKLNKLGSSLLEKLSEKIDSSFAGPSRDKVGLAFLSSQSLCNARYD